MKVEDAPQRLELVKEATFAQLLGGGSRTRYEASGVHYRDGHLYVVFDDAPRVVRLRPDWDAAGEAPVVIEAASRAGGYEDVTYQAEEKRWYCLVEACDNGAGEFRPVVDEFDESFEFLASHWLDFPVKRENKGIEGLSTLRLLGEDYLLGLCEGNACKSGSAGREPGQGRIHAFRRGSSDWERVATIKLPRTVQFADYASLDVRNGSMTVVSQVSSSLWVGRLRADPSGFHDLFADAGRTYLFPRSRTGQILYCNIEGVTWLPDGTLVVVSDRAKPEEQAGRCRQHDQSIHMFRPADLRT